MNADQLIAQRDELNEKIKELSKIMNVMSTPAGELFKNIFILWRDRYQDRICKLNIDNTLQIEYSRNKGIYDFLSDRLRGFDTCEEQMKILRQELEKVEAAIIKEDNRRKDEEKNRF